MKLGVFDSGLGGLLMTRAIRDALPDIDILYFGDTLHLPYGNRSDEAIYGYTVRAMDAMFAQGCQLIVIACNTVSAVALRRLQQEYLPDRWAGRNIIGIVVPTLEAALGSGHKRLGLIATHAIVRSCIYEQELRKIDDTISLQAVATPLLVPLIENGGEPWVKDVLAHYLAAFDKDDLDALILGCTHYPRVREQIQAVLGEDVALISQDDILPEKLRDYLARHPEYSDFIGKNGQTGFFVSDLTDNYIKAAHSLYGTPIEIGVLST
jgi:glutamate racemase